jgi:hypothetical protein
MQAPRARYECLKEFLLKQGFKIRQSWSYPFHS